MAAVETMLRWWRNTEPAPREHPPETEDAARRELLAKLEPAEPAWYARLAEAGIPRSLTYPSTTLGRMLDQTADRWGDAPALVYNHEQCSYRELLARVNRLAGGLAALGVRRGDRVLLTLPNCPEYVVSFFAIQKLGAVVVNAGPLMGADDLRAIISLTGPRVAIGLDLQARLLDRAARGTDMEHFVRVTLQVYQTMLRRWGYQLKLWHERERTEGSTKHHTLAAVLERAPSRPPTVAPDPEETAVLQPTGGTTGAPRVAELSHRSLLANAAQIGAWMGNREGQESILAVLPMFHVYGLTTCLITGIFSAQRIILATRFAATQVLDLVRRERPTIFPLVPAICSALSDEIERDDEPAGFSGLRLCISGAAPLPQAVAERFERLTGAKVIEGYGLSEASPVTHANLPGHARAGSIGLPLPDTLCRVVDPDDADRDVPPGEEGELLVSGPQIMRGYYGDADQTRRVLTTDQEGKRWLHTGDIARVDAEGFFSIVDRRKDMIIRSGLKVYPAKVERVLEGHALVKEAAVIGRPHPVHSEVVVAFVVASAAPERRDELVQELRKLCREHLAPYEVPAEFRFVEELPRSPLGKLLKKNLRQLAPGSDAPAGSGNPNGNATSNANANGNGNGTGNGNGHVEGAPPSRAGAPSGGRSSDR